MTANPVTAQDALDLEKLKVEAAHAYRDYCNNGKEQKVSAVVFMIDYLAARNLLAQPDPFKMPSAYTEVPNCTTYGIAQPLTNLDALKRPLRGADIGRYDMDYSFDQGWNQCIDEIKARMGEAQPRNDALELTVEFLRKQLLNIAASVVVPGKIREQAGMAAAVTADISALQAPRNDAGNALPKYAQDAGYSMSATSRNDAEVCADCGSEMIMVCAGLEKTCRELNGDTVDAEAVRKAVEALREISETKWSSEQINPLKYIAREALAALQSAQKEGGE